MTDDRLKFIAGHSVGAVCILGLLVGITRIAIGHVEENTSYGLMPLIVALSSLCTQYGTWAWATSTPAKEKDESK